MLTNWLSNQIFYILHINKEHTNNLVDNSIFPKKSGDLVLDLTSYKQILRLVQNEVTKEAPTKKTIKTHPRVNV
jgi:hypothetical protein